MIWGGLPVRPIVYKTAISARNPIPGSPAIPAMSTVAAFIGNAIPVKGAAVFSSHRQRKPQPEWMQSFKINRRGSSKVRTSMIVSKAGISSVVSFSMNFLRIRF